MPLPQDSPSSVLTTRTWFYSINPAGPQVMSIIDEVSPLIFFLRISFKKSCRQQMPKTLFLTINLGQAIRRNAGMIDRWLVYSLLSKAMAPHSSTLAWKIPWTEEPVRLQSMGSLRVRHDWATSLSLLTFVHWRRKWQPTPVFLPGESQGWGSLVGCRLWGHTELDTTEVT